MKNRSKAPKLDKTKKYLKNFLVDETQQLNDILEKLEVIPDQKTDEISQQLDKLV
jgi:hypothetical protein